MIARPVCVVYLCICARLHEEKKRGKTYPNISKEEKHIQIYPFAGAKALCMVLIDW
jgi:hypothetical protein